MPEELALALVVLVVVGWIIYKVTQEITRAAGRASSNVAQIFRHQRHKKFQKKRAGVAAHIHLDLPHDLEWAASRLAEATATFEEQRRASTWTPERPTWTRTAFTPHAFTPQGEATRPLNIAETSRILSPNSCSWRDQEDALIQTQCSYSALLSSPPRRTVKECSVPSLSLNPAVFEVLDQGVEESAIETYFGRERKAVRAYNARRDELLLKHKLLVSTHLSSKE